MEDKEYESFSRSVRGLIGIDLALYKEAQMNRRLRTLYAKRGFNTYQEYFVGIRHDKELLKEFLDRMTINVTEFFRNEARWEVIRDKWIPNWRQTNNGKIKCWSAACSTGEEPYSLAILLLEVFPSSQIEIIASDIDELVLERAKAGVYTPALLKGCPEKFVEKYFRKDTYDLYHIKEEVKRCVKFVKHDMLHEPFDEQLDLIICRNVMIYFTEEAKERLYHKFNRALKEDGLLFVGSTEQLFHPENYHFDVYDAFFYTKKIH